MPLSDEERLLIARCRKGDQAAWATLYRRHAGDITLFVRSMRGQRDDVEDLVQKVFLELLSSLGRFRGQASARAWGCVCAALLESNPRARSATAAPSAVWLSEGGRLGRVSGRPRTPIFSVTI